MDAQERATNALRHMPIMPAIAEVIHTLIASEIRQAEQAAREKALEERDAIYNAAVGWREHDWPEGFDRRTAELIADHVKDHVKAIRALKAKP